MSNPHDHPTALKDLQDSIYRDKVLRARAMTPEERIETVFELTELQFGMMLSGALNRLGSKDERLGWKEVRRGLDRLCSARDHRLYTRENPKGV